MITGFYANAFANTTNLRWLILDQNQLLNERLDGGSLFNLTRLVYLVMNYNNRGASKAAWWTQAAQTGI